MPGLIGIVDPQGVERDVFERMASALKLEDWYSVNLYCDDIVGLGRVSLGKLNSEQQPIFNEDRSLCICMEGELYDYAEIKQNLIESGHCFTVNNEPELVLHLYEELGADFAKMLNGAFVAAIWDFERRELIIVNDRMGLRPLYYTQHGSRLLFAALANAIWADSSLPRGVDPVAVVEFFSFEHLLGNRTLYAGISLLPPASFLVYECDTGRLHIKCYWDFQFEEPYADCTEADYIRDWQTYTKNAVRRHLAKDNLVAGVHLSGGIDSRVLSAIMTDLGASVRTFTFGIPGCGDAQIAKRVARALQCPNHFYELRPDYLLSVIERGIRLTDGTMNCIHMHALGTLAETARHVDVLYTGYLIDAFLNPLMERRFVALYDREALAGMAFRATNSLVKESEQRDFFSAGFYPDTIGVAPNSVMESLDRSTSLLSANKWAHFWIRGRQRRFTLHGAELLRSQVVCRTPFADRDLVEFMRTVPPMLRFGGYLYFMALAETYPWMAKIPYEKTGLPLIPCAEELFIRAKLTLIWKLHSMGMKRIFSLSQRPWYADYDGWMRTALRTYIEDILLDQQTLNRGYLNPAYVRKLVAQHMSGAGDYSHQLGAILTFELWNRMFVDCQV
jgi:asparagine synthase (glutamine-hydrolysing)